MLPELIWAISFSVVWGVSLGICEYNTNRMDTDKYIIFFVLGPICAMAMITKGLIRFAEYRNLHVKVFKPLRILTSEGRHQIALEKKRRERELEEAERKRLEAQNETLTALTFEDDLNENDLCLSTEIDKRFENHAQREIDEVVGPLLDAKISEIFRKSGINERLENLNELENRILYVHDMSNDVQGQLEELENCLDKINTGFENNMECSKAAVAPLPEKEKIPWGFE